MKKSMVLNPEQISRRYGVSRAVIYLWKNRGIMPKPVPVGLKGSLGWRLKDIEKWEQTSEVIRPSQLRTLADTANALRLVEIVLSSDRACHPLIVRAAMVADSVLGDDRTSFQDRAFLAGAVLRVEWEDSKASSIKTLDNLERLIDVMTGQRETWKIRARVQLVKRLVARLAGDSTDQQYQDSLAQTLSQEIETWDPDPTLFCNVFDAHGKPVVQKE